MTQNNEQENLQIVKEDEIDIIALIKVIWHSRKTIYYSVGITVLIGLIISFTSAERYTTSAILLPSTESRSGSLGGIGALAGMAGINLNSMLGSSSGIPAEIYPEIVNSYPFLKTMINEEYHFEGYNKQISIINYVIADSIPSFGEYILMYTVKLPWTIKDAFSSNNDDRYIGLNNNKYEVTCLSENETIALDMVKSMIDIQVDNITGLVTVKTNAEEPIFVAQFLNKAIVVLQDYIIRYKTKQYSQNLDFLQQRYTEKKYQYELAQKEFYSYKDQHRNLISERINPEFQRLSDNFDIASATYKSLAQQLEQAKIVVKEQTPAFSILKPAIVPHEKSWPKKSLIMVASIFIGFMVGLFIIIGKLWWLNLKDRL